jgi:hypothetical protein
MTEYRNIVSIIVVEYEVKINARNLNTLYRGECIVTTVVVPKGLQSFPPALFSF